MSAINLRLPTLLPALLLFNIERLTLEYILADTHPFYSSTFDLNTQIHLKLVCCQNGFKLYKHGVFEDSQLISVVSCFSFGLKLQSVQSNSKTVETVPP